jgi:uncharacterized protein HemX
MQDAIPGLPFRAASPVAEQAGPAAEAGWWEKLKSTLGSLVTVRRSTDEENRRVSLQDKDYVRQRLWLQVEVAYLALMRHDQAAFDESLQRIEATLAEWFDPASAEVVAVGQKLEALQARDVAVSWPDLSEPWTTLRLVRANRPVARPATQAPSTTPVEPGPSPAEAEEAPEPAAADDSGDDQP